MLAASVPAGSILSDPPTAATTPAGQPATGNVLDGANVPGGSTATVTGFSVAGSAQIIPAGPTASPVTAPTTGLTIGNLTIRADGTYTFTPVAGFVGSAPAVNVFIQGPNGQTAVSTLTLDVLARTYGGAQSISDITAYG